ncbi:btb poz domain protein [Fusarium beomiforme]|uniref:Btb poz domain protein n=1 Tax=Fusarium beomiforme TaxID=44412 RepID=A0A9P5APV6_9HYPO|nr:btb poz domain protein [Fusarium beomiforme]
MKRKRSSTSMSSREIRAYQSTALGDLLQTGDYSDLVIICGGVRYKVHKAIVCPQSRFFKAACDSGFMIQEAQTNEINLADDDHLAVHSMIEFLYRRTYTAQGAERATRRLHSGTDTRSYTSPAALIQPWPRRVALDASINPYPNLRLHISVYVLAEKYGISGLKALAVDKFESRSESDYTHQEFYGTNGAEHFIQVLREAYTSTIEADRPLRDAVVRIIKGKRELFEKEEMKAFLKETTLAYDLIMSGAMDAPVDVIQNGGYVGPNVIYPQGGY